MMMTMMGFFPPHPSISFLPHNGSPWTCSSSVSGTSSRRMKRLWNLKKRGQDATHTIAAKCTYSQMLPPHPCYNIVYPIESPTTLYCVAIPMECCTLHAILGRGQLDSLQDLIKICFTDPPPPQFPLKQAAQLTMVSFCWPMSEEIKGAGRIPKEGIRSGADQCSQDPLPLCPPLILPQTLHQCPQHSLPPNLLTPTVASGAAAACTVLLLFCSSGLEVQHGILDCRLLQRTCFSHHHLLQREVTQINTLPIN